MAKGDKFFPGDKVIVAWLDGQSYPAVIETVREKDEKVLVKFPNGEERWVMTAQLTTRE